MKLADQSTISKVIADGSFDPNDPSGGGKAGLRDGIRGILTQQTQIHWSKTADSSIILKGPAGRLLYLLFTNIR